MSPLGRCGLQHHSLSLPLLSFITTFTPGLANVASPASIALLVAQPYLIVRLLNEIWTVPTWARRVAFLGFVATTVAIVALLGSLTARAAQHDDDTSLTCVRGRASPPSS
jgi:hypothetical protein